MWVLDPKDSSGKETHDKIVALADQMVIIHMQMTNALTDSESIAMERQADAIDRQINQLVYKLYGLTEDEIRIVEEGSS